MNSQSRKLTHFDDGGPQGGCWTLGQLTVWLSARDGLHLLVAALRDRFAWWTCRNLVVVPHYLGDVISEPSLCCQLYCSTAQDHLFPSVHFENNLLKHFIDFICDSYSD
jgi:hypothetical protein